LLRVDSPAGLRGSLGARGVEVGLADEPAEGVVAAARAVPGVIGVEVAGVHLVVAAAEPASVAPELVRALVAAGADIVMVRERATTLEEVYFEVMGARPDGGEAT
jgi:hypothetical protein